MLSLDLIGECFHLYDVQCTNENDFKNYLKQFIPLEMVNIFYGALFPSVWSTLYFIIEKKKNPLPM
jgi:hypothetical protein